MGTRKPGELYAAVESLLEDQKEPYDAETDVQLAAMDQVDIVLEAIRPQVLLDYVSKFVVDHSVVYWDDETTAVVLDQEELDKFLVDKFLVTLDSIRKPAPLRRIELEELRTELLTKADAAIDGMRKLNWTGDHLYTDALDDVRVILRAAYAGQPTPILERFRCPSLIGNDVGAGRMRCQYQLPHGDQHRSGETTWTDDQSLNPPICPEWKHAQTMRGHCDQPAGHEGEHTSKGFKAWS